MFGKILTVLFAFAFLCGLSFVIWVFYFPNINAENHIGVKIPTRSNYEDVLRILNEKNVLVSDFTFQVVSQIKHYDRQVKPGYYVFNRSMNNRQIVNILKQGLQTPVTLVIYNIRTKEEFAGLVGRTLEIDSTAFLFKLNDPVFCGRLGLDTNNILAHFILDNYQFYWNTSIARLMAKMNEAYAAFWDSTRREQAKQKGLTPTGATTLASIVEKEVIHDTELPKVAGVYLNRLKKGMPLQADPPLVFALRDFTAKRVTNYHKQFDSPYNTYLHTGLPPGPICIPYKKSIDAVLNADESDYLYFCANPDLSGYSIFSKTYKDQEEVAGNYHKSLNKKNIHYQKNN
jgi:UPF0755 protein